MSSARDISQIFYSESMKLQNLIDTANAKTDMNIHEIVETYYQVMNVSSIATMLKQQTESEELLNKIQETEKMISEKFDSNVHLKILTRLSASIQKMTKTLQSENFTEKSKERIESNAELFEELRQKMSTKEFVQQYEIGISHD
jgi:predicted RND superfamily exporter protein